MKYVSTIIILFVFLPHPEVNAELLEAPDAPASIQKWMPQNALSFPEQIIQIIQNVLPSITSELRNACRTGMAVFACVLLVSIISPSPGMKNKAELAGSICISFLLFQNAGTMIFLASDTVTELSEYSKLFLPVITTAYASQGAISTSAGLYLGTAAATAILTNTICHLLIPALHFFLAIAIGHCVIGDEMLKQLKEQLKKISVWFLKTGLSLFLTYMTITGAISGASDKAVLKATKTAISAVVPVIGSTLAEASETLLISAGIIKNTIGVYGITVFLCIFFSPFFKICEHYMILKMTSAICSLVASKRLSQLIEDYCSALGLLLAMIGTECIFSVVGTVCFMRGVS